MHLGFKVLDATCLDRTSIPLHQRPGNMIMPTSADLRIRSPRGSRGKFSWLLPIEIDVLSSEQSPCQTRPNQWSIQNKLRSGPSNQKAMCTAKGSVFPDIWLASAWQQCSCGGSALLPSRCLVFLCLCLVIVCIARQAWPPFSKEGTLHDLLSKARMGLKESPGQQDCSNCLDPSPG